MATVYMGVVGWVNEKVPYGARGQRRQKGPNRSIVDLGKHGVCRIPNSWLNVTKPDPDFGRLAREIITVVERILQDIK